MPEELKSCPRCGGEVKVDRGDSRGAKWIYLCEGCGDGGSETWDGGYDTREEAVAAANRRTPSPAVSQMASDVYHGLAQDEPAWVFDPAFNVGSNELIGLKIPWETLRHFLAETLPITRRPHG